MALDIWHNPRCSKSRQTLALIEGTGVEQEVRPHLEEPPSAAELEAALGVLGLEPWELARMGEPLAKEIGPRELPRDEGERGRWIELCANPKLIERPVVLTGDGRGAIGRPPEAVEVLLA